MKFYILLMLFCRAKTQDIPAPSSELKPKNFNHHSWNIPDPEPTKQGPVLFPNDAPPPPRPPLVVTSRPLQESIARSELGENNTVPSQSQNKVSFLPFLARVKDYRPYIPSPTFDYQIPTQVPYADVVKKTRLSNIERDNRYNDYEEQTVLPPIFKALSDHARQKVLKIHDQKPNHFQPRPPTVRQYQNNGINEDNNPEYDQNQDYAFSYTVKDQKTGDDFSHSQHSTGSATNGEYRVRLPDGRMQIVSYTADENGYKADVRYDDEDKTAGNTIDGYNQHNDYVRNNQHNNYVRHNEHNNYETNDYEPKYNYVTPTPRSYVTPSLHKYVQQNSYTAHNQQTDYSDIHNDYQINKQDYTADLLIDKKDFKPAYLKGDKDYYQYPDVSKEYYDYSSEYNSNYEPHKSKFSFVDNKNVEITNKATASTVKPSYEQLKDLFVTKSFDNQNYIDNHLSTTPLPVREFTTERIVHIGRKNPNLYTDIKPSLPLNVTPVPVSYPTPKVIIASTPSSYLASTIANLKNKVSLVTKPVLSDNFISRINKYINFN